MSTEKAEILTPNMVLDSIEEIEREWRNQLKEIINSERGAQVSAFLDRAVSLYSDLENLAQNPQASFPKTAQEATRIRAIWVKSAHGTYLLPTKKDRFEGKEWAIGNDKARIDYALSIARSLTQLTSGQVLTGNWEEDRRVMMEYGPTIIYAGRWDENRDIRIAASDPLRYFPSDRLYPTENFSIIDGQIDNTADVIRNFKMPETFHPGLGDEIGVVSHSPQGVRFLFMLQQLESNFPRQATVRMFPIPAPEGSFPEYPIQELRGLVFYRFIFTPQLAADVPYPHH